jgi:hypothetical protein
VLLLLLCWCVRIGAMTHLVCRTPAAQDLPAGSVCGLLQAALETGDYQAFNTMCEELWGVQLLEKDHMEKLLLVG